MKKLISKCEKTGRVRVQSVVEGVSKTDPSWRDECDASKIIERFKKTGHFTHKASRPGSYADVSDVPDLLRAFKIKEEAQKEFGKIPATIRERFDNRMERYLEFLADPQNDEEAVRLGLKVVVDSSDEKAGAFDKTPGKSDLSDASGTRGKHGKPNKVIKEDLADS